MCVATEFMTSCYGNEHFASAYYPHQTDFHRLIHLAYSVITTIESIVVHNGRFKVGVRQLIDYRLIN